MPQGRGSPGRPSPSWVEKGGTQAAKSIPKPKTAGGRFKLD